MHAENLMAVEKLDYKAAVPVYPPSSVYEGVFHNTTFYKYVPFLWVTRGNSMLL